ncbi:MAG: helix-turn-helix domain-containing protein [Pleurocapsa sp. SU_196_0]|nr:helix-turn-helix domain-containing protein [Pleurocapsa sp. SU_196_0]
MRQILTPREFAASIGCGINLAYDYIKEGKVKSVRHGRRIVIPTSEVAGFLSREAKGATQ